MYMQHTNAHPTCFCPTMLMHAPHTLPCYPESKYAMVHSITNQTQKQAMRHASCPNKYYALRLSLGHDLYTLLLETARNGSICGRCIGYFRYIPLMVQ